MRVFHLTKREHGLVTRAFIIFMCLAATIAVAGCADRSDKLLGGIGWDVAGAAIAGLAGN